MRLPYAFLLLLSSASLLCAAPPTVTIQEKAYGEVGDWIFLSATTDGKGVKYVVLDSGLTTFPAGKLKDPNETAVRAVKSGRYRLLVYTGNDQGPSEPKIVWILVGDAGPAPPTPPPLPIDPVVPPVTPVDPLIDAELVKKFKASIKADVTTFGVDETKYATKLGEVYLLNAKKLTDDTTNAMTVGQLYSMTFDSSVAAGIPRRDKSLSNTRKVIDELGKFDVNVVLSGEAKDQYIALWSKIGASLREATK